MSEYIISINPDWDEKILAGVKDTEYRRASFRTVQQVLPVRFYIYATRPEQVFKGYFVCDQIQDIQTCWALHVTQPKRFKTPLSLAEAREQFGFRPPISHRGRVPDNEELFRYLGQLDII